MYNWAGNRSGFKNRSRMHPNQCVATGCIPNFSSGLRSFQFLVASLSTAFPHDWKNFEKDALGVFRLAWSTLLVTDAGA